MSNTITCPKCQYEIEITEVMSAQLTTQIRAELETELQPRRQQLERQAEDLRKQKVAVDQARDAIDEQIRQKLAVERGKLMEQARAKAAEDLAVELKDQAEQLNEVQAKLKEAETREVAWRKKERDLNNREEALRKQREEMAEQLESQRLTLEKQAKEGLAKERNRLIEETRKQAAEELALEMEDRDAQLAELRAKVAKAAEAELAFRARERQLEEKAEQVQLEVTRQLDAERERVREAVRKQADEEHQLKAREKDQQIEGLRKQIDELKRKAEQGSQQIQGEVQELALEELLRQAFSADSIEEVPKGVAGGDVVQRVRTAGGADCGTILWESKRTKNWSDGWLPKLRQDQRQAGAAVAVLVSTTLPAGVHHFTQIDGVWVCDWSAAAGVAAALRAGLLEVAKARRALEGQHGKMEQVYHYLVSPQFRNRVAGIVEAFVTMRQDLEAEKRALQKQWAKREKQIEQAIVGTAGMYGDFQGIIGGTLPEIEGMSLLQLEAKE